VGGIALNNYYSSGSGNTGNNNSAGYRYEREERAFGPNTFNGTGALPPVNAGRGYTGGFDFEEMLTSLRELFAYDRQLASQADSKRCGICYLYFMANELQYREEEGFYVCSNCEHTLGKQTLPMLRRQQK
jgi:hypothetical protein